MRVICIDGVKKGDRGMLYGCIVDKASEVYEGEIYIVTAAGEERSIKWCRIKGKISRYKQSRFIPLSNIDETSLLNQDINVYEKRF